MHFIIAKFLAEVGIIFVETDPETENTQPVILSLFWEMRCYLILMKRELIFSEEAKKELIITIQVHLIKRDLCFFLRL